MRLLYYANSGRVKTQEGWTFPEWFSVPREQLMNDLAINNKRTFYRMRDELISAGILKVETAKGRETTQYQLTVSEKEREQKVVQTVKQSGSFETNDFFMVALKNSLGEDIDMSLFKK